MRPPFLPDDALSVSLDTGVLLFTAGVALGTGILFGMVPALQFSRPNLAGELTDRTSQPSGSRGRVTARNALVVIQVALCFVALIGAGLFLRSLNQARAINPGFDANQLAVLSFNLSSQGMAPDAVTERQRQIVDRVRGVAGVERAAYASSTPLGEWRVCAERVPGGTGCDRSARRAPGPGEQRRRRLSRDAGRSGAARAQLHERGFRPGAARRDRQRNHGQAVLARPGCAWQALPFLS